MKVILLQDTARLGKRGELKEVSDSYAINVLIPKKSAAMATPALLAEWKRKAEDGKKKKDRAYKSFVNLREKLSKANIVIKGKKNDNGHLFAAITKEEIIDAIFAAVSVSLSPDQIRLDSPVKAVGEHSFSCVQGNDSFAATLTVLK